MTMTLTTALLIAAGLVLLALAVQGVVATRRARPKRALPTAGGGEGAGRVEPALGDVVDDGVGGRVGGGVVPGAGAAAGAAAELGDVSAASGRAARDGDPPLRTPPPRRAARIDPLIDAIAPLALESPVSGEFVLSHLPASRRAGTKPFLVEGLDVDSDAWEAPTAGHRYRELQAAVQLSGRSGALNEIEYSEFVQKVQGFAESVGAMADFPDMLEVVARARELDGMAGPLDAQLTVLLRADSVAWSVGYLQQTAARHGFVHGAVPGRLVLPASEAGAPPVLVLSFDAQAALADDPQQSAVRSCTLVLDVPQTESRAEPFPAWHRTATALADDMDATVVDDHGQPVTLHAFAAIGRELDQLYAQLEALGMPAGSTAARRLFS